MPVVDIELEDVLDKEHPYHARYVQFLYDILEERLKVPEENISHKGMPTWEEHVTFVDENKGKYAHWFVICNADRPDDIYGAVYLTEGNELGIYIRKSYRKRGYARAAILHIMDQIGGDFYANINPNNDQSIGFFKSLGFELIQHTYMLSTPEIYVPSYEEDLEE